MICYRDKTFCIAQCEAISCTTKLTSTVKEAAVKWWGNEDAPIAMADMSLHCERYRAESK